jgi:hypothetical protein
MVDLTTLAAVKAYAGVAGSTDDAMLGALVTSYSQFVRTWLNRDLLRTTYSVRMSGHGGYSVLLPQYPVRAIGSLTIEGVIITAQLSWGATGYYFDDTRLYLEGYQFTKGRGNVLITFDAGLDAVPVDLAQAVNELVGLRYATRDKQGWSSKTLAGETVSLVTKDMPDSVRTVLRQYQRVAPL